MTKKRKILLVLLILALLGGGAYWYFSGGKIPWFGKTTEGLVEYEVTYPGIDQENNMMAAGLPDKATLTFKETKTVTELSGMMGLVEIRYIADEANLTAMQSLVLFNNKYVSSLNEDQVKKMNSGYVKDVELVNGETKIIAGYKCKKAKVTLENGKVFDIYYTSDLGTPNINWSTPFGKVEGVLMEFEIERYGIGMKLVAKTVTKEGIKDKDFTVPDDYKKMPIEELENILSTLNPVNPQPD